MISIVTDYELLDKNKWEGFVINHPNGNIFHTPEMFDLFNADKRNKPIFISAVTSEKNIVGLIIAYIQKEYIGLLGELSSRAIIWGGPLVANQNREIVDMLLCELNKICRKKVIYSQFRNLWDVQSCSTTFIKYEYKYEDHLNIINDLKIREEISWKKIASSGRNKINKALREGTSVKLIDNKILLKEAYAILNEVYKKIKLPIFDLDFFERAWNILYPKGYLKCFGAFYNERLIGVRLELVYNNIIYDWYAGSLSSCYNRYPNDILPWEIIKWGLANGLKSFDFGGAGRPGVPYGVRDYKMKFGGELVNYGRYEKVHKPVIMMLAKIGFKLWRLIK